MPMTAAALAGGISQSAKIKDDSASDAAELRAGMTQLLTEHVYLAGIAVATAYATSPESPEFEAAAAAVDVNSNAVMEQSLADLDAYRTSAGEFFSQITGDVVTVEAVESEFKTHIESLAGAIDSLKAALVTA